MCTRNRKKEERACSPGWPQAPPMLTSRGPVERSGPCWINYHYPRRRNGIVCTPPSFTFAVTGYRARATTHFCSSGYNEKSAGKRKEKRPHWPHRAIELVRWRRQQWLFLLFTTGWCWTSRNLFTGRSTYGRRVRVSWVLGCCWWRTRWNEGKSEVLVVARGWFDGL